jgi:hypothetical protein
MLPNFWSLLREGLDLQPFRLDARGMIRFRSRRSADAYIIYRPAAYFHARAEFSEVSRVHVGTYILN